MLEAQIASDVANEIVSQAAEAKALKVAVVNLAVGSMRQLDEPLFLEHLAQDLRGTVAEGAQVNVRRTPTMMRCVACGEVYPVTVGDPSTYRCPSCGCADRTLEGGMELYIEDMQVMMAGESSIADKLAKAVEAVLGPVEPRE